MSGAKRGRGKERRPINESMVFHSGNRVGKAGERFVETFVEEQLAFVYRGTDKPDIGVDGEIETLGTGGVARGGFLKVQVKTTEQSVMGAKFKVPFDEPHLTYYDSLTVPPILAVVSLADRAIWWKPILHKENYRGPRGGFGIPIDTQTDRMTTASAAILGMIAERSNAIIARYLIEQIEDELDEVDIKEESGDFDFVTLEIWTQTLQRLEQSMREAFVLLKWERRYTDEISAVEARYEVASERISSRKRWFADNDCEELLSRSYWES